MTKPAGSCHRFASYLALAAAEGIRLVTGDPQFLDKLPGTPWQDHAVVLGGLG